MISGSPEVLHELVVQSAHVCVKEGDGLKTMRNAIVTPFNAFSFFSFILLAAVALLAHNNTVSRFGLAAASAFFGVLLIASFLVWTLTEGD